jgi:hypothetical protein
MSARDKTWVVVVALALLLLSGLGCTGCSGLIDLLGGKETPTVPPSPTSAERATPTATVTPTPSFPGGSVSLENPAGGFDLLYPEDWEVEFEEGTAVLAESQDALDSTDPADGALMFILSGPAEDLAPEAEGELTAEGLLEIFLEDIEDDEDVVTVGEVEPRSFLEQEGVAVLVQGTEDDRMLNVYLATYLDEDIAAVLMAADFTENWDESWPIFDAILDSALFYPPEGLYEEGATPEAVEQGDLEKGVTATAALASEDVMDVWFYESSGEEFVVVDVVAVGDWDPALELLDEAGEWLDYDDDGGEGFNSRLYVYLEAAGRYEFQVSAFFDAGVYEITLAGEETIEGGSLDYGETVEGYLDEGEWELWTFEGSDGDVISISLVGYEGVEDTYLEVFDEDWVFEAYDDDSGDGNSAFIEEHELFWDGTYVIVARAYGDGAGAYTLSLEKAP